MAKDDFESFDDLLMDEPDDGDSQFDAKEVQTLKEQLATIEKEKQGLLKGVQDERRKRQEMKGRLDQVTTTVNSILEQREKLETQTQSQKDEDTIEGIGLVMNDDGEYVLPKKALDDVVSPYQQKIEELEQELAMTKTDVQSNREYDNAVAAMVGEKPEYDPAFRQYKTARKWVSDQIANWSYNNGVQRALNSGEALSYAIDEEMVSEFNERFPGMDITTVVTAEDSPWHFKTMLQKTAESLDSIEPAPKDSRFRKVMQKPSSLGKSANARGGEESLTEKVGGLSASDIMNLDDRQIEALSRFMREDEEKGGIDW
jgi:hypothetical protein